MDFQRCCTARFRSAGCIYYDEKTNQFNDLGLTQENTVAKYSVTSILSPGEPDTSDDNWFPMPFDKAMTLLHEDDKAFVFEKFTVGIGRYRDVYEKEPTHGYILFAPNGVDVDLDPKKFVFAISERGFQETFKPPKPDGVRIYFVLS